MIRTTARLAAARAALASLVVLSSVAACTQRPDVLRNSDPALRRKPSELSADAANRHPYKAELPQAGRANGIAEVDYNLETIQLANLSSEDWEKAEVWINRKYVVFVPKVEGGRLRTLNFNMFYDGRGNTIPKSTGSPRVQEVQLLRDGQWYDVRVKLAE